MSKSKKDKPFTRRRISKCSSRQNQKEFVKEVLYAVGFFGLIYSYILLILFSPLQKASKMVKGTFDEIKECYQISTICYLLCA